MNLFSYFERSCAQFPEATVLVVDGAAYTYAALDDCVCRVAHALGQHPDAPFVGIFSHRHVTAFTGVLAALKAGKAYVPLNPRFPMERNRQMLKHAGLKLLIVGADCEALVADLVKDWPEPLLLIFPDLDAARVASLALGPHRGLSTDDLAERLKETVDVGPEAWAYMLFTSGSTGVPKGVPIAHRNVAAYVDYLTERYAFNHEDRFSNTFDLTFDLSVHDMFLCWSHGAALYCLPDSVLLAPAKFLKQNSLTVWFSVPSIANMMSRLRMLKEDAFPLLRFSLFCGEPLSARIADQWQGAASQSIVENIYGPTEATIGISHYRWPKTEPDRHKAHNGILSIGKIFDSQDHRIITNGGQRAAPGEPGELHLGGSQVTTGYWNNPEKTQSHFVHLDGEGETLWYRTGDLVKEDGDGDLFFLGRSDFQVKIRGYRVELSEIDHVIGTFVASSEVVTIAYPIIEGSAQKVYAFIAGPATHTAAEIIAHCRGRLPDYMIPADVIFLDRFPLNSNGKVDRPALAHFLG